MTLAVRRWAPRSAAGWTIAVFGLLALAFGAVGLGQPDTLLSMLGFTVVEEAQRAAGDYTRVFLAASCMASFNMGVYYLLAAATEWRPFYRFTVVFRLLTWLVFSTLVLVEVAPQRFLGVALGEGLGALVTSLALRYDNRGDTDRSVARH